MADTLLGLEQEFRAEAARRHAPGGGSRKHEVTFWGIDDFWQMNITLRPAAAETRFLWIAGRAGLLAGSCPGEDPVDFFLQKLRQHAYRCMLNGWEDHGDGPRFWIRPACPSVDGSISDIPGKWTATRFEVHIDVFEAAADLCHELHLAALKEAQEVTASAPVAVRAAGASHALDAFAGASPAPTESQIAAPATSPADEARAAQKLEKERAKALAVAARRASREAIVGPIVQEKFGGSTNKWATASGVNRNTVYGYRDGTRESIIRENRIAMAQVLDLKEGGLPQ